MSSKTNTSITITTSKKRIDILDALRGLSIILMVAYHCGFNLVVRGMIPEWLLVNPLLSVLQPFFAGLFIILAGISSRFSRSNVKRGLMVLGAAALVTIVSLFMLPAPWLAVKCAFGYVPSGEEIGNLILSGKLPLHPTLESITSGMTDPAKLGTYILSCYDHPSELVGQPILIGILHFMAAAILIFALLEKLGLTLYVTLLAAFIFPFLGITEFPAIYSADYFPLFPWFYLFVLGTYIGIPIKERRFPEWFYNVKIPVLPAVGRHTLIIYLAHQPILYGILWAIEILAG